MLRRSEVLAIAGLISHLPANARCGEATRYAGPDECRLPPAQWLGHLTRGRPGAAGRFAAEYHSPGRQPARLGRHQRLQRRTSFRWSISTEKTVVDQQTIRRAGSASPFAIGEEDLVVGRRRQQRCTFELDGTKLTRRDEPEGSGEVVGRTRVTGTFAAGLRSIRNASFSTRSTSTPARSRPSISRPAKSEDGRGRSRPYDVVHVAATAAAVRLGLGRPHGAGDRPGRSADRCQDRRRRASQPDRRSSQGRPAVRRLRVEQQRLGDRHPARHRHRDDRRRALFPRLPKGARPTPWPSQRTARRCTSPTPTTTAWP